MARNTEAEAIHVEIDHPRMTIEGYLLNNVETDEQNREKFVFFFGIPYAKPPIEKDKRFQPPEPYVYNPKKDGNPFQAKKGFKIAPQLDGKGIYVIELPDPLKTKDDDPLDCLYLNIYVPKRPNEISDPLAVMVYFHGGGFNQGSGNYNERTPESMMRHDVLLVTVNYRLGPFGFLNMHEEECKGNAGLKDQVMALRWVRDNIGKFGGDAKNVTIWGESAGGSCVNFHLISPLSQGLFHKAIIQSGGIYCPWGFTGDKSKIQEKLEKYSSMLELTQRMMVEKLIEVRSTYILKLHSKVAKRNRKPSCIDVDIGPTTESYPTDAFLPYGVEDLMKDAKPVPILAGIAALDGYSIRQFGVSFNHRVDWILDDKCFCEFLTANLHWEESVARKYFRKIRKEYFDLMEIKVSHTEKTRGCSSDNKAERDEVEENRIFKAEERLARFCTDLWFYRFYDNFKLGTEDKAPLYIYEFDLVSRINPSRAYRSKMTGAAHSDDIAYLLPTAYNRAVLAPYEDNEEKKVTTMCSLWASFSKTGTPKSMCHDIEWLPHTEEKPCYMYIGEELVLKDGRLNEIYWDILKTINEEDEQLKARRSTLRRLNARSSFRTTSEDLVAAMNKISLESKSLSSTERAKSHPGTPTKLVHSEGRKKGEYFRSCKSYPDTLDVSEQVQGREGPTTSTLQVPSRNGSTRHSPSRSPNSESKTSNDESSEAKKGRMTEDDT